MSKASPSHTGGPGYGKAGRVNDSEPSLRLRYASSPARHGGYAARRANGAPADRRRVGTPRPRSTDGTHPGRISGMRNVETPTGSGPQPVGPTQGGYNPRRDTKAQEANASGRKATGNHNRLDRASARGESRLTWAWWVTRRGLKATAKLRGTS